MAVNVSTSFFLDATCSNSKLYTVEDSLVIRGLLIGTGNSADLSNYNHLLLIKFTLAQNVLSRLIHIFLQITKHCNFGVN